MSTLHNQAFLVHMADGPDLEVTTRNPDYIRWELTAAKERWPVVEVDANGHPSVRAPVLMNTFMAWAALNRTGQYPGPWKEFSQVCEGVEPVEETPVDPTQSGHETD